MMNNARLLVGVQGLDAGEGDAAFLAAKVVTARFYCEQLLPAARGQLTAALAPADDLLAIPADVL